MSKDQQKIQMRFIQKQKNEIFKKNSKREFLKSLEETHPDLALANKMKINLVFRRRPFRC